MQTEPRGGGGHQLTCVRGSDSRAGMPLRFGFSSAYPQAVAMMNGF